MVADAVALACTLAEELPHADVVQLGAAAGRGAPGLVALRAKAGSIAVRSACERLLAVAADFEPAFLAGAVAAAAEAARRHRSATSVEAVWTGPDSGITTSRLTAATIVDLIGKAEEEVLLVSYAAHTEPAIAQALELAAARGTRVTLLLERNADNPHYTYQGIPFQGLSAERLAWPATARETGASLHAKVLVVDGIVALVGSANLTSSAMERNLECGVLVRGGDLPAALRDHLRALRARGVLQKAD